MNKSELEKNSNSYHNAKYTLARIYKDLDRAIENGTSTEDIINQGSELEKLLADNGPVFAAHICEFIRKDWIKHFPEVSNPEEIVTIQGKSQKLIEWATEAMQVKYSRARFSDKEVNIGTKNKDNYISFLTQNVKDALKGLNRSHTVLLELAGDNFHLGVSGLRDLFNLIGGDIVNMSVDDRKYLILEVAGTREKYTLMPFAWDKLQNHKVLHNHETPAEYLKGFSYNRKLNFI